MELEVVEETDDILDTDDMLLMLETLDIDDNDDMLLTPKDELLKTKAVELELVVVKDVVDSVIELLELLPTTAVLKLDMELVRLLADDVELLTLLVKLLV